MLTICKMGDECLMRWFLYRAATDNILRNIYSGKMATMILMQSPTSHQPIYIIRGELSRGITKMPGHTGGDISRQIIKLLSQPDI